MIAKNIESLQHELQVAGQSRNRVPDTPKIVLVTKTVAVDAIREAYACGQKIFGENKVQELLEKQQALPSDIEWHFIGHLQTNKVKYIYDKVALIHSLDSLKLAKEINKFANRAGRVVDVLVQVNIAEENSKFGIAVQAVPSFLEALADLEALRVRGFMTIGPFVDDDALIRDCFQKLREVRDSMQKLFPQLALDELSMGMSHDYLLAVQQGATMIRVGSLIFGKRSYS